MAGNVRHRVSANGREWPFVSTWVGRGRYLRQLPQIAIGADAAATCSPSALRTRISAPWRACCMQKTKIVAIFSVTRRMRAYDQGAAMGVSIKGVFTEKLGLVSHQNAVPLVRSLTITNDSGEDLESLSLDLSPALPFAKAKSWPVDRLIVGSEISLPDRDIRLSESYLADLTESVNTGVDVQVRLGTEVLAEQRFSVELLARNEWGGAGGMAELLPAFCTPNDPAVDKVLKSASEALRRAGRSNGIDGYEAKSRERVWELVSAIYSAICGFQLSYALPPASFESRGQKIRTPSQILAAGVATCLDTALLFAAATEQAGLNSVVVLTKGHAFCGTWLQPQQFAQVTNDDVSAVRKRVDLQELVVFETTFATQSHPPAFSHAVDDAKRKLNDDDAFVTVVDVRRARMQKIRPLSVSAGTTESASSEDTGEVNVGLEAAPTLPGFDVETEEKPSTPTGRLEYWRRKLLDLTTRNRLLHVPRTAKAVWLVCPEPGRVEDLLAAGKTLRIAAMPRKDIGGRDDEIYTARHNKSLDEENARQALERKELLSVMVREKLDARVIDLYRKSHADIAEGGSNTLFLAIGFLRWKKVKEDPKSYDAPLILLPVQLERPSVRHPVKLTMLDDEPQFNQTLLELLWQDFHLNIQALRGDLPTDDSGIDIDGILTAVKRAVRDMPGFEVISDVALSTFSFAKYLMWRDLCDRSNELMHNDIIRHLLQHKFGEAGPGSEGECVRESELDQKVGPENLFLPLPADSSQLAAVVASASGKSFVLDGPPGTGKSQTIANMIAHNLALGRRVLFVAEKRAALDVVKDRLELKGLGEFCLELHSSKASKKEVLHQLDRAWAARKGTSESAWQTTAGKVHALRDRLNELVAVLHREHSNGWSLFDAMARVIRDHTSTAPELSWPAGTQHSREKMRELREAAAQLDLTRAAVDRVGTELALLQATEWSNAWKDAMVAAARDVLSALPACMTACAEFIRCTGLGMEPSVVTAGKLCALGKLLPDAHGLDLRFTFRPNANRIGPALSEAQSLLRDYSAAERCLSQSYVAGTIPDIDLAGFKLAWQEACGKFWFLASLAKKRVAKRLASSGNTTELPDVEADLQQIEVMQSLLAKIELLNPVLRDVPGWSGVDTKMVRAKTVVRLGAELQAALVPLALSPERLVHLRRELQQLVCDSNELLSADGSIMHTATKLAQCYQVLVDAVDQFGKVAGSKVDIGTADETLRTSAQTIVDNAPALHDWCMWQRSRNRAINLGLASLVAGVENRAIPHGTIEDSFETAYAYWFARTAMDVEPLVREFVPAVQQNTIENYRTAIDELSKLTSVYIRARLTGEIPAKQTQTSRAGFQILRHEIQKKRRHKPVRQLLQEMGDDFTVLAPCMLMSPLSIAQYLPTDHAPFDLVIFDEASQVTPWDAVGAIGRAKQVIVAGDPKQMPPTNFFNRGAGADDDDTEEDMESILDECLAAGLPERSLTWHYRSRYEDLITFSNHAYYSNCLVTFPAPTQKRAVSWRRVAGVYARGKGRYNQIEAKAVAAEVIKRLTDPAFVASEQSIGVITLNAEQQGLISDLLDQAQRDHPEIERFFRDDQSEPMIVKNIETMQGDERDLIILSVGFGPTEPGATTMGMNFGPLNKVGGERRLNVAVTRARQEMMVFTSFDPSMIDLSRTSARAVADLRHFIKFADRGVEAIAATVKGSLGGYESPFEQYVAEALQKRDWVVHTQIGVSRFRIDLAVVHPDRPGDYLVGIECDGATYHSAATARDRDKVRADILRGYGWDLLRVWSTAWWVDKETETERLDHAIKELLAASRAKDAERREQKEREARIKLAEETNDAGDPREPPDASTGKDEASSARDDVPPAEEEAPEAEPLIARGPMPSASHPNQRVYRGVDLSDYEQVIDPERFYDRDYDSILSVLIGEVLKDEAPILDKVLVERIARAHGFKRAGRRIRDRVIGMARHGYYFQSDPDVGYGAFVWLSPDDVSSWTVYRVPESVSDTRFAEEIPLEELRAAAHATTGDDIALEVARIFGIRRLSQSARRRIEESGINGTNSHG